MPRGRVTKKKTTPPNPAGIAESQIVNMQQKEFSRSLMPSATGSSIYELDESSNPLAQHQETPLSPLHNIVALEAPRKGLGCFKKEPDKRRPVKSPSSQNTVDRAREGRRLNQDVLDVPRSEELFSGGRNREQLQIGLHAEYRGMRRIIRSQPQPKKPKASSSPRATPISQLWQNPTPAYNGPKELGYPQLDLESSRPDSRTQTQTLQTSSPVSPAAGIASRFSPISSHTQVEMPSNQNIVEDEVSIMQDIDTSPDPDGEPSFRSMIMKEFSIYLQLIGWNSNVAMYRDDKR